MVKSEQDAKTTKGNLATRALYSTVGLFVIGAAVAVLGAPVKW